MVLKMDTPGGLDTSMRSYQDILASSIPWPFCSAERCACRERWYYILYASHVAAMALPPIGRGDPHLDRWHAGFAGNRSANRKSRKQAGKKADQTKDAEKDWMSDASRRKAVFDAAAYIRGLAQLRGRNAEWAEKAVREAVSLSAQKR